MFGLNIRFGLSHKIMAIGAVGILGLLLVGGVYLVGASSLAHHQKVSDDAGAANALTNEVLVEMLETRRAEKDFLLRNDDKYVKRHGDLTKSIVGKLDLLKQRLGAGQQPELVKKIDAIRAGFDIYSRHFVALVDAKHKLGLNENSGLEGALRTSVHAIESALAQFDDARLVAGMLMMRRHEKDFMLRRNAKYGDEMKKTAGAFSTTVSGSSIPAAAKEDISQKLAAYQRDFFAYTDTMQIVMREQKGLSDTFAKIEPEIEALGQAVGRVNTEARSAADTTRADTTLTMQIALVTIIMAVGVLAFLIGRAVSKPLTAMTGVMGELAQGRNDVEVQGTEREDEIGRMARAVLVFRDAALEKLRLEGQSEEQRKRAEDERRRNEDKDKQAAAEQARVVDSLAKGLKSLSDGDLTFRLSGGFPEEYKQIRDDFNTAIARLQETIVAIAASAREVAGASAEISSGTTNLSQRTEEQAASLEETSASMEQISTTVKKNADNAQQANQFAIGTREVADRGGEVVTQAVSAMARIEESSRKISDIISVIDEIARQTNLLALNAAVEAARAGDAGRGFAVVASEVRSLAQRSSQAAKDIKDLITNSSGQVQEGVELVNKAGTSLSEIVDSIKKVVDIVADITAAGAEQSTGIDQVNTALSQMDEVTQQNSALVEQNAAAAKALEQQSQAMDQRVSLFRLDNAQSIGKAPQSVVAFNRPAADAAHQQSAAPAKRQRVAVPARRGGPVGRMQAALATAHHDDPAWKKF